jgi:hypothetical protein
LSTKREENKGCRLDSKQATFNCLSLKRHF